ncbi:MULTISPECIES: hypothetical protein [unclassified Arsenophonus]|uniref:hypothetical protein n=1 Tax=unclassified Arsenophonus TaxID=2627083 RepID=UPI002863F3E3|nr:hypothetical protein [Arsenophonus sp.]MDR5609757.1 hypothetical protein [Arsenophonus sp.]MDR5613463.1 hypothetical protein [Arsenophonus sp.]
MKKYLFFLLLAIYGHDYVQAGVVEDAKQEIAQQQPVSIPINSQQINKNQIYPIESHCLNIKFVFLNGQELFTTSLQKKLSVIQIILLVNV